jgi:outer membrane receptor protein involved in Fe transport
MKSSIVIVALAAGAVTASAVRVRAQQPVPDPAQPIQIQERVDVVGVTPIHGLGVSRDKVPANVQTATATDIARTPGVHVGDVLANGFASVNINEAQANPFQPDIQFRGFAASPLLGLPQGIAVYQDGVRMNEPFGDTVNWDLLPTNAIASVNLMPGSNPLFGLNALGGALSLRTKTGFTHPGHGASVFAGSFGRVWTDLQSAAHNERLSYFVTARFLGEDGWRDFSESRVRQLFGNVEWRSAATTLGASVTAGANRLVGNGPAPVQLLEEDRRAVFTHPDETKTDLGLVTLSGRHQASRALTLDAVLSYRPATVSTFNGDDTVYEPCDDDDIDDLLCEEEDDDPIRDQFGNVVPVPAVPYDGTNNTSGTRTHGWGAGLQATLTSPVAERANNLIAGVSFDGAGSRYESDTELARLTETRGTEGVGIYDQGASVRVKTTVHHTGAYVADYFTPTPKLTLAGSARLAYSTVTLEDQIGEELNGEHSYTRLNPSLGATFQLPRQSIAYGSFSVSSRVPTPSELTCADPEDPCRLPNAFVADPPLEQVVAQTWEGGLRGRVGESSWNLSVFRTANRDDILFISSGSLTNQGYFANVGDTLRRGIEVGASGRFSPTVSWAGAYTYLRATFETPLKLSSPNHPDEVDGEIDVTPGSTLPGVPQHNAKGSLVYARGPLSIGATLVAMSSQYLRGDEANLLEPVDGFATLDLSAGYRLGARFRLAARVTNLFDAGYETFGLLGEADEVLGDDYDDPRFLSPGAPRAAWVGVEIGIP